MQKIDGNFHFIIWAWIWASMSFGASAAVSPELAEKIKMMTARAVKEEPPKFVAAKEAYSLKNAGYKLDLMSMRMNSIYSALQFFSRFKKKLTVDAMEKVQPEISKACCPLRPQALTGQKWYFKGRGNKLKGKGLSGQRKDKAGDRSGKGKKNGKVKRGRKGGNAEQKQDSAHLFNSSQLVRTSI